VAYINLGPAEQSLDDLIQRALDRMGDEFPGWVPREHHLEVVLIEEAARIASVAHRPASQVPARIFERYGESVVGLPRNMDGSEGPRARDARAYARRLSEALAVPVKTWDERLTTAEARRTLLDADMSRAKRKKVIDKLAAVLILEGYLQSRGCGAEN